jgi:hypothetical protein
VEKVTSDSFSSLRQGIYSLPGVYGMPDEWVVHYKTYIIRLLSYRRDGQWVPLALVSVSSSNEGPSHPVSDETINSFPTKDAADALAKNLAIQWIDSQLPSVTA